MWMQLELAYLLSSLFLISFVGAFLAANHKHLLKRIRVRVNCWFCNGFARVPYEERNSFYCPGCKQYNGFRSDGGYNRSIPEQYDELLNPQLLSSNGKRTPAANGLCRLCNNNQQLKVYQLAHFVPMHEENYDAEIEHFQKQLEKAYKLCSKCDRQVKKTILKQNKWMLGLRILSARGKYPIKASNVGRRRGFLWTSAVFLSSSAAYLAVYKYERTKSIVKSLFGRLQEGSGFVLRDLQFSTYFRDRYTLFVGTGVIGFVVLTIVTANFMRTKNKSHCQTVLVTEHQTNRKSFSTPRKTNYTGDDALDSDYESFHEALTKKRRPKNPQTSPIFGQGPVFENSLNKSQSPLSFRDLNLSFSSAKSDIGSPERNYSRNFSPLRNDSFRNDTFSSARDDSFREARPQVFNDLDACLSNLRLNSNYVRPRPLVARSPSLRNPWTGQSWHDATFSRSSSQSSGVYSAASNYGDADCRSVVSEPVFKYAYVYKSQGRNGSAFSSYLNDSRRANAWDDAPRSLFEVRGKSPLFM